MQPEPSLSPGDLPEAPEPAPRSRERGAAPEPPAPNPWLRRAFIALVVRPIVLVVLGLNIRRRENLPAAGPAIIVANHNSHLDTLTLQSLFPLALVPRLRPVAAADYFLTSKLLSFIALKLIGIIPIVRGARGPVDPLGPCRAALDRGEILILFPEGSRGEPEKLQSFKRGIAHLARSRPDVPVTPVFLHGLGKALPKGSKLLVPVFCDVFVGEAFRFEGTTESFMTGLEARMATLASEGKFPVWE